MRNPFDIITEKEKKILESTYDCSMKVIRRCNKGKVNGRTQVVRETVYTNIPCAKTRSKSSENNQTTPVNEIQYSEILFCSPNIKIFQGDTIEITDKNGTVTSYNAGVPDDSLDSHLEVILERKDRA